MSDEDAEIVARLERAGIPVVDIERVSVTKGGDEIVYEVTTTDRVVFARTVRPSREDGIRRVLEADIDVGIPESRLLEGDPALFVMERAEGRPLSTLLPVYLTPGLWWLTADGLASGFEALGRYHGRLHASTRLDSVPLGDSEAYGEKLRLPSLVRPRMGETFDNLEPWTERARDVTVSRALIHSDPTPHNLYYKSGNIALIDVDFRPRATVKDRLAVECGVELMTRRLPYGRRSQAKRLLDAYYRGYDIIDSPDDYPYWVYLVLKAAHYCWILEGYMTGDDKALRDRLTSVTDERIIVSRVEELADVLGDA